MAEKGKDPLEAWHSMLGEVEKSFNAVANKAMESEDFSRIVHTATGASAMAKKSMGDVMERYLATMNLPSRGELTNIGERLQAIEARLNELTLLLYRIHGGPGGIAPNPAASVPRPPRTKKPSETKPAERTK